MESTLEKNTEIHATQNSPGKPPLTWNKIVEAIAKYGFFICALTSVAALVVITLFIFMRGIPGIAEIGLGNFLFGLKWDPRQGLYGIFPMIVSSFLITAMSFVVGSLVGRWTAIYLAEFCPGWLYRILKPMVELLAGIPSVIYGFFGLVVIVPFIRENFGGPGKSMLACVVILSIMILPTVINLSEASIRAVPRSYYEGAVALGTTHTEAVFRVVVPAAKSGINASYILGIGRALGETMAVLLVAGNNPKLTVDLLSPVRTLTTGIALEMSYASGLHQSALFGIGAVLFVLIFALNLFLAAVIKKEAKI